MAPMSKAGVSPKPAATTSPNKFFSRSKISPRRGRFFGAAPAPGAAVGVGLGGTGVLVGVSAAAAVLVSVAAAAFEAIGVYVCGGVDVAVRVCVGVVVACAWYTSPRAPEIVIPVIHDRRVNELAL